jgi:predicted nucleotide-binding protein
MEKMKTIVLVDNSAKWRNVYASALRLAGYEVFTANTVKAARKLFDERQVDLAIVDLRLKRESDEADQSGLNLAAEVDGDAIPVIILTGVEKKEAESAVKAFQRKGLISSEVKVLDKGDGPEPLIEAVHMVIVPKVFLVHGHDHDARKAVVSCLNGRKLRVVVLQEELGANLTIIEKVERHSDAHFAVILITPDDVGSLREPVELKPRARQNVIFEYGYFLGKFGRDRVVALYKGNEIERPSDCDGIQFLSMDSEGRWHDTLLREIAAALHLVKLQSGKPV